MVVAVGGRVYRARQSVGRESESDFLLAQSKWYVVRTERVPR